MQDAPAVVIGEPAEGCWVGLACELSVETRPASHAGDAPPAVRTASPLEVLAIAPGDGAGRWSIRTIAFESGAIPAPRLAVEIIDASGGRRFVDTPPRVVTVQQRDWPVDAALAGFDRLAPLANPLWWPSVIAASFALGVLALCASRVARRGVVWLNHAFEPIRLRLHAARFLRHARRHGDVRLVYQRIVVALRVALTFRVGHSLASLTAQELASLIERLDLVPLDRRRLVALLTKSDAIRFGGRVPLSDEVAADLAAARALVTSRHVVCRRPRP